MCVCVCVCDRHKIQSIYLLGNVTLISLVVTSFKNLVVVVIYKAFCLDVAQGRMNGTPNETRTH